MQYILKTDQLWEGGSPRYQRYTALEVTPKLLCNGSFKGQSRKVSSKVFVLTQGRWGDRVELNTSKDRGLTLRRVATIDAVHMMKADQEIAALQTRIKELQADLDAMIVAAFNDGLPVTADELREMATEP